MRCEFFEEKGTLLVLGLVSGLCSTAVVLVISFWLIYVDWFGLLGLFARLLFRQSIKQGFQTYMELG